MSTGCGFGAFGPGGEGIQYIAMKTEDVEAPKISKPAVIFCIVVLIIVAVLLASKGTNTPSKWDEAANAPAEKTGLAGVSEEERYSLKAAGKTPSDGAPVSEAEQQAYLDAAAAPEQ